MKVHQFGPSAVAVSELCLGTSTFARYATQENTFAILDAFHAAGGNFIQTSGICPGATLGDGFLGLPEEFLRRWLNARGIPRQEIVLATRMRFARPLIGGGDTYGNLVRDCVRDSLRRIGTDHVDFLVIEWSHAMLPLADTLEPIEAMVRTGHARQVVLAHFPTEHLDGALRLPAGILAGVQLDYSLIYRSLFERGVWAFCREHQLGFMARSPLAGGHLVAWPAPDLGSFRWRTEGDPSIATCAHAVWPVLSQVARRHHASPAQVALAWVLGQPDVTSTLISVRSLPHMRELIAATRIELSADERERLEAAATLPAETHMAGIGG